MSEDTQRESFDRLRARAELRARLEVLRVAGVRRQLGRDFVQLEREAERRLGRHDEVYFECVKSRISAQARRGAAADAVSAYAALLEQSREALPAGHELPAALGQLLAQYRRKAGDAAWEEEYRRIVDQRVRDLGERSRASSIARLNLAVALRGGAEDPTLGRDQQLDHIHESHSIARDEWRNRLADYGDKNPFVWIAAAAYCRTCITAAHLGAPFESPDQLLRLTGDVVQARQSLLGIGHRKVTMSKVAHAEAATLAGDHRHAVWRLLTVQAEAYETGLETRESLPTALALALLAYGTPESLRQAEVHQKEAMALVDEQYGPASRQARWLEYLFDPAR